MNKKLIRLTESDLHKIVKESVKKVLKESSNSIEQLTDTYFNMVGEKVKQGNPYRKAQYEVMTYLENSLEGNVFVSLVDELERMGEDITMPNDEELSGNWNRYSDR